MAATATAASASTSVILQSTYPSRQSCQFLGSSSPALANLAFRVRVFDPESSADHSAATAQPHAHHAHAAAVAVAVSGLQPGSHSHGGNGISIHLAESNAVTGNQPIVDQVVAWQEQM
ncbi:hypothetical protein BCR44DRAFT_36178 [Catenaria anguillulae PL171]|uniref:Uncharacterized protein n=1 Tax=Catenaria anguillulae PL171 TaxID=765915 RepID=A0A1Y2HIW4_9FUNG|nr:hypothetical protein BCR44DRAFT_36178 [Catenaria anguillulae PL171]